MASASANHDINAKEADTDHFPPDLELSREKNKSDPDVREDLDQDSSLHPPISKVLFIMIPPHPAPFIFALDLTIIATTIPRMTDDFRSSSILAGTPADAEAVVNTDATDLSAIVTVQYLDELFVAYKQVLTGCVDGCGRGVLLGLVGATLTRR